MKAEVKRVTPDQAKQWLDNGKFPNRKLRKHHLRKLSDAMRAGEWKLNGETIKFDHEGHLIDGQHRLTACINSGCSFDSYIASGLESNAFDTIDQGLPRTLGDALSRDGVENYFTTAGALRIYWILTFPTEMGGVYPTMNRRLTVPHGLELYRKNSGIVSFVKTCLAHNKPPIAGNTMLAGFWYACSMIDREQADRFWLQVITGNGIVEGTPADKLRTKLVEERMKPPHKRFRREGMILTCVKCWNAFRDGVVIKNLRIADADYTASLH
jgi:hypothetical protein